MSTPPLVTVAIPTLNEEAAIGECLERVLAQTHGRIEVLVADGGSTDRTRAIVAAFAAVDERVRLLDNPGRRQSAGLNRALAASTADVLARLDARSYVGSDYVARCLDLLSSTGAAVVGGRMEARHGGSRIQRGIAVANGAWWGAGPARFHRTGAAGPAETVYLGTFRVEWLEKVGGWAEDVGVNEDYELNHRIRAAGGVVWLDPDLSVGYQPRRTYAALSTQYFRYGRSKSVVVRRHPRSTRARQVLPAFLVPAGVAAATAGRAAPVARAALVGYGLLLVAGAVRSKGSAADRLAAVAAAAVMHWSWSAGFLHGLCSGRRGT